MAICVGFRNNFRRREVVLQHTVLCLVEELMCALEASISIDINMYGVLGREEVDGAELTYPISLEAVLTAEV